MLTPWRLKLGGGWEGEGREDGTRVQRPEQWMDDCRAAVVGAEFPVHKVG